MRIFRIALGLHWACAVRFAAIALFMPALFSAIALWNSGLT